VGTNDYSPPQSFSALQRAEIAEIALNSVSFDRTRRSFSALQRAEIAEISWEGSLVGDLLDVSVDFIKV